MSNAPAIRVEISFPSAIRQGHGVVRNGRIDRKSAPHQGKERKMASKRKFALFIAAAAFAATPASAGEITGTGVFLDMHGNSACSFSGLNDTPDGDEATMDPGGRVQSYGFFLSQTWLGEFLDPAVNDPREPSLSPGWSCNPTRGGDFEP